MKTLILTLLFSLQQQPQVYNFNGVYYGQQNTNVVNLGWYINDSYPNELSNYLITRNGQVVYSATLSGSRAYMVSIPVERGFKSATFTITRTVNGVISQSYSTFVRK
jgi:hypothetical protein